MNQRWYIATETFSPHDGEKWTSYIAWSGLAHLDEVVSLDQMLCPTLLPEIKPAFWPHIVNEQLLLHYFVDLEYLLAQVADITRKNLLCVIREPGDDVAAGLDARFQLLGFDLIETATATSALVNCGGFPRAFRNDELNSKGLLPSLSRARAVQASLRADYPDEHHAHCDVWQISRAIAPSTLPERTRER